MERWQETCRIRADDSFDLVYAHQFYPQVVVDPKEAKLAQTLPLQSNPPDQPDIINGGIYDMGVDIIGLGFAYTFDKGAKEPSDEEAPVPAVKPAAKPEAEEEE